MKAEVRGNQPVGYIQGQGLPGRVVHHCRVALEESRYRPHYTDLITKYIQVFFPHSGCGVKRQDSPAGPGSREWVVQNRGSAASRPSAGGSALWPWKASNNNQFRWMCCVVNQWKQRRLRRRPHVDWEAFSSNQRAWRMAARALCSTLMSTEGAMKIKLTPESDCVVHSLDLSPTWIHASFIWGLLKWKHCRDSTASGLDRKIVSISFKHNL